MNQTEEDFIEFLSQRNGEPSKDVRKRYEASKNTMNWSSKEYRYHCDQSYRLLQPFFSDHNENSLFESYRYHAYLDILRMISYSFPKPATWRGYLRILIKSLKTGDFKTIVNFLKRKLKREKKIPLADILLAGQKTPIIVDYGCGLAYGSFEMAKKLPGSKVILVDLDTIKIDFAEFCFKKYGIHCETIRITKENQYPLLPKHHICIATDVMEHLYKPLLAYGHIHESMVAGGILYGDFDDHKEEMFHVHSNMTDLRAAICKDYKNVGDGIYKKFDNH